MKKSHNVQCPYCNATAILRPASYIHGKTQLTHGKFLYVCRNWPRCDAYVSAHIRDKRPMASLANGILRYKRIQAHKSLEQYRKLVHMDKASTYLWLQAKLNLPEECSHIAKFSEEMCDHVIALCKKSEIGLGVTSQ